MNAKKPTAKQLRYLRSLAVRCGETFAYPTSCAQASAEIERLLARPISSNRDRRHELLELRQVMAARSDAASVRQSEIVGYGSSAHWR
jgi:hypothetical protein